MGGTRLPAWKPLKVTHNHRYAVSALLAALAVVLAFAASASAAPLPGSSFDSQDGDQVTNTLPAAKDWQDVAPQDFLSTNLDNQATDDCFIGGVKEDSPNAWSFNTSAGGCTPAKSDLLGMWSHAELTTDNSFLHAAFARAAASGNTFITFELNKTGATWTNSVGASIPCRSNGDLLLSYEVGGSTVSVTIFRWTGDGTGPASCPNGANGTFSSSSASNNGLINSGAITNYLSPATIGNSLASGLFGEAQIDVSQALSSMGVTGCYSYLSAQAHSRSSSSISSALIDYVPPVATKVANCAVTGTVYNDANTNGLRDVNENGMSGRTAYVDVNDNGSLDAGEPSAVTDAQGYYLIPTTFTSGSYNVRVVVPAGATCTAPAGTCANPAVFLAGSNDVANDFGLSVPASVAGTVYEDADANGTKSSGEIGLAGATVVDDTDNNGVRDPGEAQTTSAADGTYTLDGLSPGTHRIRALMPAGYTVSEPSGDGGTYPVTLTSGQTLTARNFGGYRDATVAGRIYRDADADGARGSDETGLEGRTVFLDLDNSGSADAGEPEATTDNDGAYSFGGLRPDTYTVRLVVSPGEQCTGGCAAIVTVASGEVTGPEIGVWQPATVSGRVLEDENANGAADAGEGALEGRTVWADVDNDGELDAGEPSATTDAEGNYTLAGLKPGSYTVRLERPAGWHCETGCGETLPVTSGETSTVNFTQYAEAEISGTVYDDADGSGSRSAGEAGLAGRTVSLDRDADGVLDATTTTDPDGRYAFTGLKPDAYRVTSTAAGWACTAPASCRHDVTITSGQGATGNDFGLQSTAVGDLRLTKTAPTAVKQGEQFTYTLTVVNDGPGAASDVTVTDHLPAGVQFVSAPGCAEAAGTVTCPLGAVANGADVTRTITVRSVEAGSVANTAEVSSPTPDATPGNDAATATVNVAATADVSVTKTGPATVVTNDELIYALTVRNNGPSAATGVTVADQLPAGMTYVASATSQGACTVSDGKVSCSIGNLATGATATVKVTARPTFALAGRTVANTATVSSEQHDSDAGDDSSTHSVQVFAKKTTLRLRKTVDSRSVKGGNTAWFTITAKNTGKEVAANVRVCDIPAANTSFVTAKRAKFSEGRACWTTKLLAPGQRVSYRVKVRVSGSTRAATITNWAAVRASNANSRRASKTIRVIAHNASRGGGVTG